MFRKKWLIAFTLCSFPMTALGQWSAGVNYINLADSGGGRSMNLGVLAGSVGYAFILDDAWSLTPELRYGLGVQKHSTSYVVRDEDDQAHQLDVATKINRFVTLSLKAQYVFDAGIYLFAGPTYNHLKSSVDMSFYGYSERQSTSRTDSELGYGLGAGYRFTPAVSAELQYESFDSKDVTSLGLRFQF